jgi:hypothetical protein
MASPWHISAFCRGDLRPSCGPSAIIATWPISRMYRSGLCVHAGILIIWWIVRSTHHNVSATAITVSSWATPRSWRCTSPSAEATITHQRARHAGAHCISIRHGYHSGVCHECVGEPRASGHRGSLWRTPVHENACKSNGRPLDRAALFGWVPPTTRPARSIYLCGRAGVGFLHGHWLPADPRYS